MRTQPEYSMWELIFVSHVMRSQRVTFTEAVSKASELRTLLATLANALDGAEGAANVGPLQRTTWALVDALDDEDRRSAELPEVVEVLALAGR